MEWEERTRTVIDHYKEVYTKYQLRTPRRPNSRIPEDRAIADKYVRWCDEHDTDELLFMEERFRQLHETKKITPGFRFLRSEVVMKWWKRGGEYRALEKKESDAIAKTMLPAFDQTILDLSRITPDQERYRMRHFIGNILGVCMVSPELSGGYHPQSKYCTQCAKGPECVQRLNKRWKFNVVALRAKRLDLLPPVVAKIAAGI